MAIFKGLQFCFPLGLSHPTVESDCFLAVRALEDVVETIAAHWHLIMEILKLKNYFVSCNFSYVSRLGNQVAHSLARHAQQVNITTVWWDSCPDFLVLALWIDSNM